MIQTTRREHGISVAARISFAALCAVLLSGYSPRAAAEPYLAVPQGWACGQCHMNPTGSGLRNAVGNAIAQSVIPAHHLDTGDHTWTGAINDFIAAGGDLRAAANLRRTTRWSWACAPVSGMRSSR